jgi:hypothetical protein
MKNLPYAEDLNYWKTSQNSPDTWIDKTKNLIHSFGGKVLADAYGNEQATGRSAYMLMFEMQGDRFKLIWPVLPSKSKNTKAAQRQAATMLFYDTKARLLNVKTFGARVAFFQNWLLPDGRTAAQASVPELQTGIPSIFSAPQLVVGEIVEE